ncbi:hypothetical protein CASFOL_033405 [Castilleja foliolosa]|uniref:Serine-threonine/tyrosine-protein kinase catalytic domain-containing protein n=1 Tax=Castilleja foliolosa TaxID=1961234 RepID=A0ABD3BZQ1_9LAMI
MTAVQAPFAVVNKGVRPTIPNSCLPALSQIMTRCWDANPDVRPSFSEVVMMLEAAETEIMTTVRKSIIRSNLQYAAISALRRLPLDPGNPAFLHRAVQGVLFSDPVAVRHSLEILSELASKDPYAAAMALGKHAQPGGALQDVLHLNDVLARVALAKLCHTVSRARALDERPDIKSQFNSLLYQLLLDPSERVCFEAILCVLGKFDNSERTEERAGGWYRLSREILKLPDSSSKNSATISYYYGLSPFLIPKIDSNYSSSTQGMGNCTSSTQGI